MSMWKNKAAFARFLDQAVNNGNLKVVDEIFHQDFVGYLPDSADPARGRDGCRGWVQRLRESFKDVNSLIEGGWLIGEVGTHEVGKGTVAQRVAAFVVLRGTHTGVFANVEATRKRATWTEVHLLNFENGQVIQDVVVRDTLSVLRQIGVTSLNQTSAPTILPPVLI
jgi:hypothetical protein